MAEFEPTEIRWDAIRFQRSNVSYRFLLSVCQLVLDGMLITTDEGERRLARFVDDQRMSRLFEKFILEYYEAECSLARASSLQIKWALDDGFGTMLPVMQSDIMLSRGNRVLIIDAKYYTRDAAVLRRRHDPLREPVPDLHLREEQGGRARR